MKNDQLQNSRGVMLITGATSGFGAAAARMAVSHGFQLVLTGRRTERLQRLQAELGLAVLKTLAFDVCDLKATQKALSSLDKDEVPHVLINNAGLAVGTESVDHGFYEDWNRMIDTNLKGLLHVTRELTPRMTSGARIINIGSIAGRQAYPGGAVYNASKFAVHGLTQAMRMDLLPRGIQVAQVAPGAAETEFSQVRFKGDDSLAKEVYLGFEPLRAEDVADAILYIATRPAHVSIQDMLIMPAAQASAYHYHKS
ncbi:MAG: NAD(P)-dependent oxidoreductase [Crocinitomicaceae bacterium]|jgi:NADP-dependent 3-hydroxy acid dehydrogenase YdfG|nr:NAD(P)-dependent oxidoreductase [Crocinitomicaceae bacterium]|tara:strand:+ start:1213 stop:1977 length:765 start_codon:yes stop_codon:yes gene_type:complete